MHGREGVHLLHCINVRRSKSENTLCRKTMVEEIFYENVLSKPRKADNESEKRK